MTPVENLRGSSFPGSLKHSQSRAASNVVLSYSFKSKIKLHAGQFNGLIISKNMKFDGDVGNSAKEENHQK